MNHTLVAFGKVPQKKPERGTTPGNAAVLLQNLVVAARGENVAGAFTAEGAVRRAFHAMTGEYPEPGHVRAILSPET